MMLVATSCVQQVSVNLIRPFCPGSPTTKVLRLLLQISVSFKDIVLLRFLLALFPHLVSSSSAETIAFISEEYVTFPTCVGSVSSVRAALHLLILKQIAFPKSLQVLQANNVAAQNL